jgi:hypothetical protein
VGIERGRWGGGGGGGGGGGVAISLIDIYPLREPIFPHPLAIALLAPIAVNASRELAEVATPHTDTQQGASWVGCCAKLAWRMRVIFAGKCRKITKP